VTLLVGFLGAGKTTLLNRLLTAPHGRRVAVIVNDYAALNIDARLVRQTTDRLVEMSNGCICCTLREDLVDELGALAQMPDLDYILIESTGIGEPMPIAQSFYMGDLPERLRLDTIVTVVDAAAFWTHYNSHELIEDAEGQRVEASLAPLLVDQIEFSNVIVLNKCDLAEPAALADLEAYVRQLNPLARIERTVQGDLDPLGLFDTGAYDYATGPEAEAWEAEWLKASSEVEEYGFASFVYRQPRPLRREAFMRMFEDWPANVLRAKGFVVFADDAPAMLSLAGDEIELETLAPAEGDAAPDSEREPDGTEIVFIGRNLPVADLSRRLDDCASRR